VQDGGVAVEDGAELHRVGEGRGDQGSVRLLLHTSIFPAAAAKFAPYGGAMELERVVRGAIGRVVDARTHYRVTDGSTFGREVLGLDHVTLAGNNLLHDGVHFTGDVSVGWATTIGHGTRVRGPLAIGSWCQIAPDVAITALNHPVDAMSTYVNERLPGAAAKVISPVVIGHDVWVGHSAVILPGVTVGTGAVIGAGAVVTHDVEPYTIVTGNPGRPMRRRLPDAHVEWLLQSEWWDARGDELTQVQEAYAAFVAAGP
jgi:acetyltransferase-like isoleucine patch superfamily enzyme